jgi:hypothetical protein
MWFGRHEGEATSMRSLSAVRDDAVDGWKKWQETLIERG